ncbi:tRNA (adenine(58)-N(1))-methyltransferase non-catalytic subunit TRM6 [Paramuricea clavata]|uniref:tRNA (adenine(58)-N(1))-methyltransferase non-catalytic subunit TRM6 n=1 Tax=Paramuricea clavata TaxID=317549 RepID=A0A6S7G1H8_PARCT|nr:tRNA (adenine(58)-N(1))-methyltransferase non-catalytic subunit TRM6 [Paramuricea clavata]
MSGIIEEGSRVIIQKGTYLRSEEVLRKNKVSVQKLHFYLDNAIGCNYGTTFKVGRNGHLTVPHASEEQPKPVPTSGENNQFLNDDGSSQKLTKDTIMNLKAQGFEGEDIIEQLIENSETFKIKTEFSQEKYLNKKRKRHISQVTILKPTLRLVCQMMYSSCPSKIMELRTDTVSQILTMANIHSNINVLLLENTQSFLAGAILHRMAGHGNVVQLYNGDFPIRLSLPHFALAEDEMKILSGFPMNKINILHSLEKEDIEEKQSEVAEEMDSAEPPIKKEICDEGNTSQKDEGSSTKRRRKPKHYNKPLTEQEKHVRKINRIEEENRALELLKTASFDSLIIATKFRSKTAVLRLIEFLAPSRPVVVYSPYKEVLNECLLALKESKSVLNLDLTETWWRSYQVLTMRTHPHIMMDGTGGYLLTGIKVDPGLNDSTDNPNVNRNPAANPPVNPTNPGPSTQDKTDVKPVIPAGTSDNDPDPADLKDNPGNKSDTDHNTMPDGDSAEPPSKRTKSS